MTKKIKQSGFFIESLEDRYRVHGVQYQEKLSTVDISKALLDNGASHIQSDWIEMTKQGEWKLPSGPLYFAVLAALYGNKNAGTVEEVRKMLAKDFKDYFMMTSTRICYASHGSDKVVHDFGYATERTEEANIVGADGYINETSGFGAAMNTLVGINDCHKVEQVGSWMTDRKSYLWRFNSKLKEDVEFALVLVGNYVDRFGIYAYGSGDGRARGMVIHSTKNKIIPIISNPSFIDNPSLKEVCQWWVRAYPKDVFTGKTKDSKEIVAIRKQAELLLRRMK